ncbi:MAG: hypothetical protein ABI543_11575 [Ignavibacteria bacterium]
MENSKIVRLLKTFTKPELNELERFVSSPYFSRKRDCMPLLKSLRRFWPEFDERSSSKAVYEFAFSGKTYGDKRSVSMLSTISSELYKLAVEFLRYSEFEKEENQKKLLLLRSLRRKNLRNEFEKEFGKQLSDSSISHGSAPGFLESSRLNSIYSDYLWDRGDMPGLYETQLISTSDAMAFALITGFKFMDLQNTAKLMDIKTHSSFTDIVLDALDGEKMLEAMQETKDSLYPYISANYYIYMMKKIPGESSYYNKLKQTLESNIEKFGHTEKYMLYQAMETHLVIELEHNSYNAEVARELFELYRDELKLGIHKVSPEGYLEPTVYRNIFLTACDINEFEWAEEFINMYSRELPAEFAESMKNYSLARLYFIKKDFEKALQKISGINYDYPLHKIDAKVLHFKICYELGRFEQAFNILDTAKHYLSATLDIPNVSKKRNNAFFKYAAEVLKQVTSKVKDKGSLLKKVEREEIIESRVWLIEKIQALKSEK